MLFVIVMLKTLILAHTDVETLKNYNGEATEEIFSLFQKVFNKNYQTADESNLRFQIFKFNLEKINDVNSQNLNYKLGINQFADMTPEEFAITYLLDPQEKKNHITDAVRSLKNKGIPEEFGILRLLQSYYPIDWRKSLQLPRDQGQCKSSYAIATTTIVEGALSKNYNINDYISTQELLDCERRNKGCRAGTLNYSVDYVLKNGLSLDKDYPYQAKQLKCRIPSDALKFNIASFSYCSNYDTSKNCSESIVYDHLAKGPTAVGIDGSFLQLYKSGIFDANCTHDNHFVVAVGYATENGQDYWIVRNSWGADWGENGHVRVARNRNNKNSCFVANESWTVNAQ
jgi:hypothetical protein